MENSQNAAGSHHTHRMLSSKKLGRLILGSLGAGEQVSDGIFSKDVVAVSKASLCVLHKGLNQVLHGLVIFVKAPHPVALRVPILWVQEHTEEITATACEKTPN